MKGACTVWLLSFSFSQKNYPAKGDSRYGEVDVSGKCKEKEKALLLV